MSSGLKNMWSTKSMKEDSLSDLHSKTNMPSSSGMQSNNLCPESVGRDSNQSADINQHFNSFDVADPTWLFSTYSGDSEARPPPGLSISRAVSTYRSKSRVGNSEHSKDSSFCSTSHGFSDSMDSLNDPSCLPSQMIDLCFTPYQNVSVLNGPKTKTNRSFSVQDGNKLASHIQALLMGEQGDVYKSEWAQNSLVKTQDANVLDMKSLSFQNTPAFASHVPTRKREMTATLREQRGGDVGRSHPLQSDYTTKELSGFSQASDYFEPPKSFSSPLNPPTPPQSKEASQRETRGPQTSFHQYYHGQSNHPQNQAKLQAKNSMKTDHKGISKLMTHSGTEFVPFLSSQQRPSSSVLTDFGQENGMNLQGRTGQVGFGLSPDGLRNVAGGDGGDFTVHLDKNRLQGATDTSDVHSSQRFGVKFKPTPSFMREADKQQGLLQNPFQILGSMYTGQTRHGGSGPNQAKPAPSQVFPYMYQMGDPRQNSCHVFPSRSLLHYGASVPLVDMGELLPDGEFPTFNPYLQELIGPNPTSGDGPFTGLMSTMRSPKFSKCRESPMSQLHHYLEVCYEQWRMLEKERKKVIFCINESEQFMKWRTTIGQLF